MSMRLPPLVCLVVLAGGCRTPPLPAIDQDVGNIVTHPFDEAPAPTSPRDDAPPPAAGAATRDATAGRGATGPGAADGKVIRASYTQDDRAAGEVAPRLRRFELTIPREVPGSETPLIKVPAEPAAREGATARLYPELPPLTDEPIPRPGPDGRPLTLADLQRIAAANSPLLRQAASDVEAARGVLIQVGLYPNPMTGYEVGPNANNTGSGVQGFFVDQVVVTGGKLKVAVANAEMNLRNAKVALKRARYDLATTIRGDYYSLLVAKETVRVNKALARLTDEIFRLQADLLAGGFAASYEPAGLRAQAFSVRLAYQQAIQNYIYAWKQLVADMGLKQSPLSAVDGEIDRLLPYFDYDAVLAHVLRNHTDVLTARNNVDAARYALKLARILPVPDLEFRADLWKENMVPPFQNYHEFSVSFPLAIFNRNQGGIRTATAALVRAAEGPHQAEVNLTTGVAAAYASYRTNLISLELYRRDILPDQIRYYRGVFERRKIDPDANFNDLVTAQQTVTASVNSYLGILGQLWTSVVNVADYLQTDDFYQLGKPLELPPLPDFDPAHPLPCPHPLLACPPPELRADPAPLPGSASAAPPATTTPARGRAKAEATTRAAGLFTRLYDPARPAGAIGRGLLALDPPAVTPSSLGAPLKPSSAPPGTDPPPAAPAPGAAPPAVPPPGPLATTSLVKPEGRQQ